MPTVIKYIFLLICLLNFIGCGTTDLKEAPSECSIESRSWLDKTLFLPEAEKRLLEAIGARKMSMLGALSYIAENPSYLIIEANFDFDVGNIRDVFILRMEKATDPWETAEVYLWESTKVEYTDFKGEKISRHLLYPSELIALPEHVRTNLLGRIEDAPWYKGPKSNSSAEPKKERNYVY